MHNILFIDLKLKILGHLTGFNQWYWYFILFISDSIIFLKIYNLDQNAIDFAAGLATFVISIK